MSSKPTRAQAAPESTTGQTPTEITSPDYLPTRIDFQSDEGRNPEISLEELRAALTALSRTSEDPALRQLADVAERMLVRCWTMIDETRFHLVVYGKGNLGLSSALAMLKKPISVPLHKY